MPPPNRIPLGRTSRRLPFERRLRLWLTALALPTIILTYTLLRDSPALAAAATAAAALLWLLAATIFLDQFLRPLQTLSNVVAALREDDFSFRARGARRNDALGDLALEINSLASTLQAQRASANDALTLVERVLSTMQSPVLAFDTHGTVRLQNQAATQHLPNLADLEHIPDQGLYSTPTTRWSVRRTGFRLHGVPHTLLVLTDVAAALREEERQAWQRLIRVIGHEINNSLTPIKSIAGTLRTRPLAAADPDFHRGLAVIEDRAASLNRFLQAYQRLSRLPPPTLVPTHIPQLIQQIATLEPRLPITIHPGPSVTLQADPDQLQQALINLLQNAVDAACDPQNPRPPAVAITWTSNTIQITDNGQGITNPTNLFVPFYTTKPTGSGIGLVLVQQIATAHHGTITLTPAHPGTTATLTLPPA
jgi:nitrogen fixation/metabolism regulation signal transduction histidine kinase